MSGVAGYPGFLKDFVRGSTVDFTISVSRKNPDTGVITPLDITGARFIVTISLKQDSGVDPSLVIVIDPPTDPINGITEGSISDSQTFELPANNYYYSVRYINVTGAAYVIDMGRIKVYEGLSGVIE